MCIALSVLAVVCRSDKDFKDFLINIFIFPCIFLLFRGANINKLMCYIVLMDLQDMGIWQFVEMCSCVSGNLYD